MSDWPLGFFAVTKPMLLAAYALGLSGAWLFNSNVITHNGDRECHLPVFHTGSLMMI